MIGKGNNNGTTGYRGPNKGANVPNRRPSELLSRMQDIRRACDRLAATCDDMGEKLAAQCESLSEKLDSIAYDVQCLEEDIGRNRVSFASGKAGRGSRMRRKKPQALATVFAIEFTMRLDGRGEVRINQAKTFILPRALAEVMGILFRAACKASNEPVSWTSYSAIAAALLGPNSVKPLSVHAISNRVYRLRETFSDHGYDPSVLERASGLGAKLTFNPAALPDNAYTPGTAKQVQSNG